MGIEFLVPIPPKRKWELDTNSTQSISFQSLLQLKLSCPDLSPLIVLFAFDLVEGDSFLGNKSAQRFLAKSFLPRLFHVQNNRKTRLA